MTRLPGRPTAAGSDPDEAAGQAIDASRATGSTAVREREYEQREAVLRRMGTEAEDLGLEY